MLSMKIGQLRPLEPLPLQEQENVLLQVIRQNAVQETAGILRPEPRGYPGGQPKGMSSPSSLKEFCATLPSGRRVFIDANIFIYHFNQIPLACRSMRPGTTTLPLTSTTRCASRGSMCSAISVVSSPATRRYQACLASPDLDRYLSTLDEYVCHPTLSSLLHLPRLPSP